MSRWVVFTVMLIGSVTVSAQTEGVKARSDERGFFMVGAGMGTPSGIMLIAGYDFGPCALRASGGGWTKGWYGIQGNLAIHFNRSSSFAQGVSIIGGRLGANPVATEGVRVSKAQNFLGLTYDIYLSGFVFQAGLAFGKGDYPSPDGVYQCGYVFEF